MPQKLTTEYLGALLSELRSRHGVVGATLGVLQDGRIEAVASGLSNLGTGIDCTPDTVFQIGSIGKIFTSTLVMQLRDEGRLSIDDTVIRHLPDFTLADQNAAAEITVRQLLNHTSGMEGDFFPADDPEGPSTLSYIRKMAELPSIYPPGRGPMAYCNSGFVTAGRIVEILTGLPWQLAAQELICKPLGLTHFAAYPHEALRYRCAMGHVPNPKDRSQCQLAPATFLPLSAAAAGTALSMSVEGVLKFAAAHMAYGELSSGKRLLEAASANQMQTETIPVSPFCRVGVTHWGLGWMGCDGHGYRMVGHDGATLGQFSYLRAFPELGIAFALLTNSPSRKLYDAIESDLMQALIERPVAAQPPPVTWSHDPQIYIGRYSNIAATFDVQKRERELMIHVNSKVLGVETTGRLEPYCEDVFTICGSGTSVDGEKVTFHEGGATSPHRYIRLGLRLARRVPA